MQLDPLRSEQLMTTTLTPCVRSFPHFGGKSCREEPVEHLLAHWSHELTTTPSLPHSISVWTTERLAGSQDPPPGVDRPVHRCVGCAFPFLPLTLQTVDERLMDLLTSWSPQLCGAAQNIRWLIACRAFQGIGQSPPFCLLLNEASTLKCWRFSICQTGGGGIMSMTSILVGDIVPYSQRGKYQGYLGGVWGVASVLGPILGGLLTDKASWRCVATSGRFPARACVC